MNTARWRRGSKDTKPFSPTNRLVMDIIREDTYEMKQKYGDERRTEIAGCGDGCESWKI
jgi:hypothetical protein